MLSSAPSGIVFVTSLFEGWPAKGKEAPSPHELRLISLDTIPEFLSLRDTTHHVLLLFINIIDFL